MVPHARGVGGECQATARGGWQATITICCRRAAAAVPGPAVPNYWVAVATWRDPASHLHYGALPPQNDDRVQCMFWRDEAKLPHPDCRRIVERNLKPGERWTADTDEPQVLVFGFQEKANGPPPWSSMLQFLDGGRGAK